MAKKKIALITGVSGQDGAYLAKFLLNKNYKVIGSDRRSARNSQWRLKRLGIDDKIIYEELEMGELFDIDRLFKNYKDRLCTLDQEVAEISGISLWKGDLLQLQ